MRNKFQTTPSEDGRQFDFLVDTIVDGKVISVYKRVFFSDPDEKGRTNMALIDVLDDGTLSDSARSGYGQVETIFATVAHCLYAFLNEYPDETVYFEGSDPEGMKKDDQDKLSLRQILYNRVLSKAENYELADNHFVIYGVYKRNIDIYKPNSQAKAFLIKLKK